jgi:hypothetical protein
MPEVFFAVVGDFPSKDENKNPEHIAAPATIKNPVISFLTSIINIDYSPKGRRVL